MSYDKIVPKSNQLYHVPLELHIDEVIGGIIDGTIKINIQIPDVSDLPTQITRIDTELGRLEDVKVDKIPGKGLSDENYTLLEKNKLAGIEDEATKNETDAQLRDRTTHTGEQPISTITGLQDELDSKVDKVPGQGLSDENFTLPEKTKLAGLESSHWKGEFLTEEALYAGVPNPQPGDYANVDAPGENARRFIWDSNDEVWVEKSGIIPDPTPAQIKELYEDNPNTNAYTDAEKAKLAGIATGATKNATDAQLRDRTTHTGEQPISTITDLQDELDSKVNLAGDQTIEDVKTFSKSPVVPTPTTNTAATNKKYVDDSVAGAIGALDYIESENSSGDRVEWIDFLMDGAPYTVLGYRYELTGQDVIVGLSRYGLTVSVDGNLTTMVSTGAYFQDAENEKLKTNLTARNIAIESDVSITRIVHDGLEIRGTSNNSITLRNGSLTFSNADRIFEILGGSLRYSANFPFNNDNDLVSKKYVDDAIVASDSVPLGKQGQFIGYNEDGIPTSYSFSFESLGVPLANNTSTTSHYVYVEDSEEVKSRKEVTRTAAAGRIAMRNDTGNLEAPTEANIGTEPSTNPNHYVSKVWSGNITPEKHRLVVGRLADAPGTKTLRKNISEERMVCQAGTYTINHFTPTGTDMSPITYLVLTNAHLATIAWGSTIKWSNNEPPEFEAGHRYRLGFIWDVDSERWIGSVVTVEVL